MKCAALSSAGAQALRHFVMMIEQTVETKKGEEYLDIK